MRVSPDLSQALRQVFFLAAGVSGQKRRDFLKFPDFCATPLTRGPVPLSDP